MRGALILALLLVSSPSFGQTAHPCDGPMAQTPVASGAPLKVEFCARPADTPETAIVRIDAVVHPPQPITQTTPPNAAGLAAYQTTNFVQVTRGSHVATMSLTNRNDRGELQEGPLSNPFPFDAVDPKAPPSAPIITRVIR